MLRAEKERAGSGKDDLAKERQRATGRKKLGAIMDCTRAPEMSHLALLAMGGLYVGVVCERDRIIDMHRVSVDP